MLLKPAGTRLSRPCRCQGRSRQGPTERRRPSPSSSRRMKEDRTDSWARRRASARRPGRSRTGRDWSCPRQWRRHQPLHDRGRVLRPIGEPGARRRRQIGDTILSFRERHAKERRPADLAAPRVERRCIRPQPFVGHARDPPCRRPLRRCASGPPRSPARRRACRHGRHRAAREGRDREARSCQRCRQAPPLNQPSRARTWRAAFGTVLAFKADGELGKPRGQR